MKHSITRCSLLLTLLATLPAFARFSEFVCISPDNPRHDILPVVTLPSSTQDCVTVQVPVIKGSRQYWLIVCKESLSPDKQNFRRMFHRPVEKRDDVVRVTPLTADTRTPTEAGGATNGASITIQLSQELGARSYIYIDYPQTVMDGGYYYAIDIPAYLKRLTTKIEPESAPR